MNNRPICNLWLVCAKKISAWQTENARPIMAEGHF